MLTRAVLMLVLGGAVLKATGDPVDLAVAIAAANALGAIPALIVVGPLMRGRGSRAEAMRLLGYGWPLVLSFATAALAQSLDRLIIAQTVGPAGLGAYGAIADFLRQSFIVFGEALALSLISIAKRDARIGGMAAASPVLCDAARAMTAIAAFGAVFFLCFDELVVTILLGPGYRAEARSLAPVLVLASILMMFRSYYFGQVIYFTKTSRLEAGAAFATLVTVAAISLLLIPRLGAMGAALAFAGGQAAACLVLIFGAAGGHPHAPAPRGYGRDRRRRRGGGSRGLRARLRARRHAARRTGARPLPLGRRLPRGGVAHRHAGSGRGDPSSAGGMTAPVAMPKPYTPQPHSAPLSAPLPGGLVAAIRPLDPAAPWVRAWEELGQRALVTNPFYEAPYALAAAPSFGAGVRMLLVADRPPEEPGARLAAAWPHRSVGRRWGLPLPVLMGWTHGYAPLGVPLLDGEAPGPALSALWPRRSPRRAAPPAPAERHGGWPLRRPARPSGHAPRRLLGAPARDARRLVLERAERAAYLDHLSGNRRRRLRRARRRLEAGGDVAFTLLAEPALFPAALDAHIALEAASWKGQVGTALAQRPEEAAMLRGAVAALAQTGRVRIAQLRQGGRLIASMVLPLAGRDAFVLKVAHDDTDPAAATGVQLVHRLTEAVLASREIDRIDSCAPPGFELATLFWTERRSIAHMLLEAGHDPLFPVAMRLERGRRDPGAPQARDSRKTQGVLSALSRLPRTVCGGTLRGLPRRSP